MIKRILRKIHQIINGGNTSTNKPQLAKTDPNARFQKEHAWLKEYHFNTILDVGANTGQFAKKIRNLFPTSTIISFEPILEVYSKLVENFKGDSNFQSFNFALGDSEGKTTFNLNEFSDSSSMLKLSEHKQHFDFARQETEISINIKRLDEVLNVENLQKPYLVKLDVQGFEDKVIDGGKKIIEEAAMIITEVSFYDLYEGQPKFNTIYEKILALGFEYVGNYEQLNSPVNNKVLQADAIFIKKM